VKDDAGLEDLKSQLRRAEYDKELKDSLREKLATSWTLNQSKVSLLYVKADSDLRKIMPSDTLAKFYKYDVQLKNPEFPDIEKMFYGTEKNDEGK
jgi:hypothetical protein